MSSDTPKVHKITDEQLYPFVPTDKPTVLKLIKDLEMLKADLAAANEATMRQHECFLRACDEQAILQDKLAAANKRLEEVTNVLRLCLPLVGNVCDNPDCTNPRCRLAHKIKAAIDGKEGK